MQLFKDTKSGLNYDIISKSSFKKVLRWHSSITRLREWEASQYWYSSRVSEIEKSLAPLPNMKLVNRSEVIKDHIEGNESDVSAFLLGK